MRLVVILGKYTQAKIAQMFGIAQSTVSMWNLFDVGHNINVDSMSHDRSPQADDMHNVNADNVHNEAPPKEKPDARTKVSSEKEGVMGVLAPEVYRLGIDH